MDPSPYEPRSRSEITYLVNARQKTYLASTEIYIPNNPYVKLEEGYEPTKKFARSDAPRSQPTQREDKEERSSRRAKTAVKDIALTNSFELFATFTFATDRFDIERCRDKLNGWLKRQRKKDKSFQYLVVPELHKKCEACVNEKALSCSHDDRPKALHFHVLMHGYTGEMVRALNKDGSPKVKHHRKVYDFPNYTLGHSEVYMIGDTEEDRIRVGFYLLKYIRKEMPSFENKKRYWSSRGLSRPLVIENPEEWYLAVTPDHVRETEFGKYLFFDNKRIEVFLP